MTEEQQRIDERAWELFTFAWGAFIQAGYEALIPGTAQPVPPPWNDEAMWTACLKSATTVERLRPEGPGDSP